MLPAKNFHFLLIFSSLSLTLFQYQVCHSAPISTNNLDEEIESLTEPPIQQLAVLEFDDKNNLWDNLQIVEKSQASETDTDTDKKSEIGVGIVEFQGQPTLLEAVEISKNDMPLIDDDDDDTAQVSPSPPLPPLNSPPVDQADEDSTNFFQSTAESPIEQKEDITIVEIDQNVDNNSNTESSVTTSPNPESLTTTNDDKESFGVLIIREIVNSAAAKSINENGTFSEIVFQIIGDNSSLSSLSEILHLINSTDHETNDGDEEMEQEDDEEDIDDGSAEKNLIDTISAEERASYPVTIVGSKLAQEQEQESVEFVKIIFETETTSPLVEPELTQQQPAEQPSNPETGIIILDFPANSENDGVALRQGEDDDNQPEHIVMSPKIELVAPIGHHPDHLLDNNNDNVEEEGEMTPEALEVSMGIRPFYFLVGPFNMKNNSVVPSRNESDVLSTAFIISLVDSKDKSPSSPTDIIHALATKQAYSISALQ